MLANPRREEYSVVECRIRLVFVGVIIGPDVPSPFYSEKSG